MTEWLSLSCQKHMNFPGGSVGKESACNAEQPSSTLGLGRSSGEGNGSPLQYSCLENPTDEEPARLKSIGLPSQTRLSDWVQEHSLIHSFMSLISFIPTLSRCLTPRQQCFIRVDNPHQSDDAERKAQELEGSHPGGSLLLLTQGRLWTPVCWENEFCWTQPPQNAYWLWCLL